MLGLFSSSTTVQMFRVQGLEFRGREVVVKEVSSLSLLSRKQSEDLSYRSMHNCTDPLEGVVPLCLVAFLGDMLVASLCPWIESRPQIVMPPSKS
jgi:hypothetical protein